MQTRAAEPSLRHEVTEVLDAMVATGLTVLRTWAFNDGETQWNALQPRPGAQTAICAVMYSSSNPFGGISLALQPRQHTLQSPSRC